MVVYSLVWLDIYTKRLHMLSDTEINGCCSLRSHHSPGAVGIRERFHEKDQGSLILRKEKYQSEQKGGGEQTDCSSGNSLSKDCACRAEKSWSRAEGSYREVVREHLVEAKRSQI